MSPFRLRWLLVVVIGLCPLSARAMQQDPHLARYEARTIVTGTDMRSRPAGFAACLDDVLVKVSGDPTVLDDPRLADIRAHAAEYVSGFDYWDRMSGIAHHDEQGSSDRPYNLTVRFDPTRIAAALQAIGRTPWTDPRPDVTMRVHVFGARDDFDLTEHEPRAAGMRAAIVAAAQKYGLPVRLPSDGTAVPVGVVLVGQLVLSAQALGWVASWHLDWRGVGYDWGISGVNFDEAFRAGIRGSLQILSDHGAPH